MNRRAFMTATGTMLASASLRSAAQDTSRTYRACIIGDTQAGGYGHDMHRAFALQPSVEVAALADPDEAGRAQRATECGAKKTYADYREMLAAEKPDIVAVGPRTTVRHKEYLLACAEIGAHGYMEKPLCVDIEEADAMLAAVSAKNLKWNLAYNMRVTPIMERVKQFVIDEQGIGTVLEVRARGKEDNRAGAEDMIVLGTHLFDLMAYFLGAPLWCMADLTHNGKPATPADVREATEPLGPIVGNRLHAMYGFDQGRAGHFSSMKTRDPSARWGLELLGSKGAIAIHTEFKPQVWWLDDPAWRTVWNGGAWKPIPNMPEVAITAGNQATERHRYLVADLLDAIEKDREPAASIQQSIVAQEMIQACFASYTTAARVPIPLANRTHPLRNWKA